MNTSQYNEIAEDLKPQKQVGKHCLSAFIYGGIIGAVGQGILEFYMYIFDVSEKEATPMMIITIVLAAAILTGLGIYDRIGKKAGAGTFIPITGFATNMFKLGGTVITFGIVASFVLGGIRYVISLIW